MVHTELCAAVRAAQKEWLDQWPEHCVACCGAGGYVYYENHGLPGLGEQFWEPCACVEEGRCPRCGVYALDDEYRCTECGWTLKVGGCPAAECFCWEVLP